MRTLSPKAKKAAIWLLSALLVVALTTGGTLAYLTAQTERRLNSFSFASELNARLVEPNWDGIYDYEYGDGTFDPLYGKDGTDYIYGYGENDPDDPLDDPVAGALGKGKLLRPYAPDTKNNPGNGRPYGDEASQLMVAGNVAEKNPMIFNTSALLDEWVAAKITFVYASGANAGKPLSVLDYTAVKDIITVDWNNTNWEVFLFDSTDTTGQRILLYKSILAKSTAVAPAVPDYWNCSKTIPMFTTVTLDIDATPAQVKKLEDMGGFAIYIEGFVVQAEIAANYAAFKTWAENGEDVFHEDSPLVFENTPTGSNAVSLSQPGGIFSKAD